MHVTIHSPICKARNITANDFASLVSEKRREVPVNKLDV
jgi:hypothetical protein